MRVDSLSKLFLEELSDVYSAEQQILKALPKMIKATTAPELGKALEQHLAVTEAQVERLDKIFEAMDESPKRKKCKGMAGLLEEGQEMLKKDMEPEVKDAAIIASAQRVEHYEMAAYGTLRSFASMIGSKKIGDLLERTLDEEKQADASLSELAERTINPAAMELGEETEEEELEEVER